MPDSRSPPPTTDPVPPADLTLHSPATPVRAVHVPGDESAKAVLVGTAFQGPIPSPQAFEAYDKVLPGAADRILTMAERNGQMVRDYNLGLLGGSREQMRWNGASEVLGSLLGCGLAVMIVRYSYLLIMAGHTWAGGIGGGSTLVTLTLAFILGRPHLLAWLKSRGAKPPVPPAVRGEDTKGGR